MTGAHLPIRYRMEIYVDSFARRPVASFPGAGPFAAVHTGDEMEPSTWPGSQYGQDMLARVTAVRHLIWLESDHIRHSLSVCVNIERKSEQ